MSKYRTILADPPWYERGGGKVKRGADRHYPLMKTKEIEALGPYIRALADPAGSHLYLWTTNNHLPAGLKVMKAWGWRYVTCITWAKNRIGLGQYYRGRTEQLLFGVRGKVPYKLHPDTGKRMQSDTLIEAPRGEHSQKPEEARQRIEHVSFGPYLELFARQEAPGWDVWGDEVDSDVLIETEGEN